MENPWRAIYDHPQSKDPFVNGIPDSPLYIDVEPTNACNFECSFCEGKHTATRPKGTMEKAVFAKIVSQAMALGIKGIRFLRWGEPLLHPEIVTMVDAAHSAGLKTHITTNGSLLTVEIVQKLIEAGLDSIIISFQGVDQESYEEIRGEHYHDVVNNIINLVHCRDGTNSGNPYIHVSTTITNEKENDIKRWKDYWGGIVDSVGVGLTRIGRLNPEQQRKANLVTKSMPKRFQCIEVMNKMSVDWDGAVSPCCMDYDQQMTIGNIKDTELKDLWMCDEARAIRFFLKKKRQDLFVLCSTCELNYDFRGKP